MYAQTKAPLTNSGGTTIRRDMTGESSGSRPTLIAGGLRGVQDTEINIANKPILGCYREFNNTSYTPTTLGLTGTRTKVTKSAITTNQTNEAGWSGQICKIKTITG